MGFADQFVWGLNAATLQDDAQHHAAEPLAAAALADLTGAGFGALLTRVKYADGSISKTFESGTKNLAQLLRIWTNRVTEKGRERRWVKEGTEWDVCAAMTLYHRVAERSLAYWLDGKCDACHGTGTTHRMICQPCKGSGRGEIGGGGFEREKALDMVSELEGLLQAHNARSAALLR
jgi:hypothetical protein